MELFRRFNHMNDIDLMMTETPFDSQSPWICDLFHESWNGKKVSSISLADNQDFFDGQVMLLNYIFTSSSGLKQDHSSFNKFSGFLVDWSIHVSFDVSLKENVVVHVQKPMACKLLGNWLPSHDSSLWLI